jgi:hypothetical protein
MDQGITEDLNEQIQEKNSETLTSAPLIIGDESSFLEKETSQPQMEVRIPQVH